MIVTYLVVGMYFSLSHMFFEMKLFVSIFVLYLYLTHFKKLPTPILNFLNFFGGDATPTHPLKILKKILVVIAYNFQKTKQL